MAEVKFHSDASRDLRKAQEYYARAGEQVAKRFRLAMKNALRQIAKSPEASPMCDDAHRQLVLRDFPYSIIYRVDDGTVIVVAVAHASRDPDYWRNRV